MKKLTPMRAIQAKCLDCMCGNRNEVKLCPSDNCPLYNYRSKNVRRGITRKTDKETPK